MKEKEATFSFDNLNCLSALIMIISNYKKINRNFKETFNNYSKITNFGHLECPKCHSHDYIYWGHYERGVIYFSDDNCLNITSNVIKIQRVKCKSCGKTHALLPIGIIPYKQITTELINSILINIHLTSLEKTYDKFNLSLSIIRRLWYDFNRQHKSRLQVITNNKDSLKALQLIDENINLQMNYIPYYKRCFMQIKLGCIGVIPLLGGAPT